MTFVEGSKLERIGEYCFDGSGIEEIKLPSTLREIGYHVFDKCDNLMTIYVEDGCEASLADAHVPDSPCVITLSTTLFGGVSI